MKNCLRILVGLSVFFSSCKKSINDLNDRLSIRESAMQWFQGNGGAFAKGSMIFNDSTVGLLEWDASEEYLYKGVKYIEVPYVINKKDILLKDSLGCQSFAIVIKCDSTGKFEGAFRSTNYNNHILNLETGIVSIHNTQSYTLLDGTRSTFWYRKDKDSFLAGNRLTGPVLKSFNGAMPFGIEEKTTTVGSKGKLMLAPGGGGGGVDCITIGVPVTMPYVVNNSGPDVIIGTFTYTEYVTVCNDNGGGVGGGVGSGSGPGDGFPNPTPGGGGGSGGNGGGFVDDGWRPAVEDFDLGNIPELIPDVQCIVSKNADGTIKVEGKLNALMTASVTVTFNIDKGKIVPSSISSNWSGLVGGSINQIDVTSIPSYSDHSEDFNIKYKQEIGFGKASFSINGNMGISYNHMSNTLSAHWR